jgi:hypothetical protein
MPSAVGRALETARPFLLVFRRFWAEIMAKSWEFELFWGKKSFFPGKKCVL